MLVLILLIVAAVLFGVGAYLAPLPTRLGLLGLLAWVLTEIVPKLR